MKTETPIPDVSVLMSVYNSEKYLAEAVNSILSQSFRDFEFLIVNDGSTDRSSEILEQFASRDHRIQLITQPNAGVAAALKLGLAKARGTFLARMDSDDVSLPNRLERQLTYMKEHPECVAVGCHELTIDPEGWPIRVQRVPLTHEEIDAAHMRGIGGSLSGPSVFMRLAAVMDVGGYRPEFVVAEDFDLFLRLAEVGRVANLPDVLFHYREHDRSLTRTQRDQRRLLTWKALHDAHERRKLKFDQPLPPPADGAVLPLRMRWAQLALASEYYPSARKHAWRQFTTAPAFAPLKILLKATARQIAEPWLWVYDLIRGRPLGSRSRIDDKGHRYR